MVLAHHPPDRLFQTDANIAARVQKASPTSISRSANAGGIVDCGDKPTLSVISRGR
jgi:hypothetical protein